MRSTFDLDRTLRTIKPEKRRRPLSRRSDRHLTFVGDISANDGPFLLDTCVYLDGGKGKLPPEVARILVVPSRLYHSAVAVLELSYTLGRLDPLDARTKRALPFFRETLARIREDRTVVPDGSVYAAAGVLLGTMVRTQHLSDAERRRLLPDCLLLLSARKAGLRLLTANAAHFDLLQQIVADAKLAFYSPLT